MHKVFLSLGGNLGDRLFYIERAETLIEEKIGRINKRSPVYETSAWGIKDQPDFLNRVVDVDTDLSPQEVLESILSIEKSLGRIRKQKWAERNIDIDILLYDQKLIDLPGLTVPHPYMQERKFILQPLSDIAGKLVHPVFNKSIDTLLKECTDKGRIEKFETGPGAL